MTEMSLNELAGFLFLQIVDFSHGSANRVFRIMTGPAMVE